MKFFLPLIFFFLSSLFGASASNKITRYTLSYNSKDTNCTLSKDNKDIPAFDTRFKRKAPKNSYTCFAIQKEQYNDCRIVEKKNATALVFSYGVYEYTNLIISFKTPTKHINGFVKVECTKSLSKRKK